MTTIPSGQSYPVRQTPRPLPPDTAESFGIWAPATTVDAIFQDINEELIDEGHQPLRYAGSSIKAVAYFSSDQDISFREEPILLDNGGNLAGGMPVLNVVLRRSEEQKSLQALVCDIFADHRLRVRPITGRSPHKEPYAIGTLVYFLKRRKILPADDDDDFLSRRRSKFTDLPMLTLAP